MNNLVSIEQEGQKVLTTEQLASIYECENRNIHDNFKNNEDKFIENIHYFKLEGNSLKDFKNQPENIGLVGQRSSTLYL